MAQGAHTERAPSADRTLLGLMLEHSTDGICLVNAEGTILATTPAIERMLGRDPGSLRGTNGLTLLHPDDADAAVARLHRSGEDMPEDYRTYRFLHARGHYITVELIANENPEPIREAPEGSLVLTVRDITRWQEARLALDESIVRRELVANIAAMFVDALDREIDGAVARALAHITRHTGADRGYVYRIAADGSTMVRTHGWSATHTFPAGTVDISTAAFPNWSRQILALETIVVQPDAVDPPWPEELKVMQSAGITALLAVPLVRSGTAVGFLALDVFGRDHRWSAEDGPITRVLTDIIGSALARRDASDQYRAAEARFRAMVEHSSDALIVVDAQARINHLPVGENLFGYRPEDLLGTNALDLVHPDDVEFATTEMLNAVTDPAYHAINAMRIRHADGHWVPIELVASTRFDEPAIDGVIMNVRDVTERMLVEEQLKASETRLAHLIANVPGAVFRCEPVAPYHDLFISDAVEAITGYEPEEFYRRAVDFYDLVPVEQREAADRAITGSVAHGDAYAVEYQFRHRDGSLRWVEERGQISRDDNDEPQWIDGAMFDLTERKRLEARLEHDAAHDPLTGLPNRTLLVEYLETAIGRARRTGLVTAALFLDLDRFKLVNDALGHAAGDELLVHFSRRLRSVLRDSDLAARTGGDEFVIICSDLADIDEAEVIAGRIADLLRNPFTIRGRSVFVSASIGIAIAERVDSSADEVLRNADAAAYLAKDRGRNRYEVFDDALRAATAAALEVETDLHRALGAHQLFLRYQPVVELETGVLAGAEGLVRWQHPVRGLLTPDEFLPAAEVSGLIVELGHEVLELAVGAISDVDEATLPCLAINLSPRELAQPDVVDRVRAALADRGVEPHRLCIEITETAVLDEGDTAIATLRTLRDIGVRLAIDDFGTGYSSLSYLRRLPVDLVKIDRSFTAELGADGADTTIVASIIGLARGLGLDVVAEGIETPRQLACLRQMGCTYGQGYLFSAPVALDDMLSLTQRLRAVPDLRH